MLRCWFSDVRTFMDAAKQQVLSSPQVPSKEVQELRRVLNCEEWTELLVAEQRRDLASIADAIADLVYVLLGMANAYGLNLQAVWHAVHTANMQKLDGPVREDGKKLKPPGWQPPDIGAAMSLPFQRNVLTFRYENWKGEEAVRRVLPLLLYFGSTEYHPEPSWLLRAFDLDKQAIRDFAIAGLRGAP